MKVFNFKTANPFMTKTHTVETSVPGKCKINVKSAFIGKWSFELDLDYELTCNRLNQYCSNNEVYLQNLFPELPPALRENFLSDPNLNIFKQEL